MSDEMTIRWGDMRDGRPIVTRGFGAKTDAQHAADIRAACHVLQAALQDARDAGLKVEVAIARPASVGGKQTVFVDAKIERVTVDRF